MKKIIILISLAVSFCSLFVLNLVAQDKEVEFRFEVDGKPVQQKFKIQLDIDGKVVEAKLSKRGFYIPLEFQSCKDCDVFSVRFSSKKYILAFDGVYRKDLDSDWVLGIDNKPFDVDNINTSRSYENVRMIQYLNFRPKDDEIATGLTVLYPSDAESQLRGVKVRFEVDGKEVKQKFKVLLYVNDKVIEPPVSETGFTVPPDMKEGDEVKVRFLSGKHDLFFDSLHSSKFGTDWIVGVDNKPFHKENIDPEETAPEGKELSLIYYIHFVSKGGLDTRQVMKVYKDKN